MKEYVEKVRPYWDRLVEWSGPVLHKLGRLNARVNLEYLLMGPKAQYLTAVGTLALILLFVHSGSGLLVTLGVLSALVILVGWGVYALLPDVGLELVEPADLVDLEGLDDLEPVILEGDIPVRDGHIDPDLGGDTEVSND